MDGPPWLCEVDEAGTADGVEVSWRFLRTSSRLLRGPDMEAGGKARMGDRDGELDTNEQEVPEHK